MNETIITLPADFDIPTNMGLHGDTLFFELDEHQLTTAEPRYNGDTVTFSYRGWDSDEGEVLIAYTTIDGSDAEAPAEDAGWDVSVTTGSDVWGLADTQAAINDAIRLHHALGRDAMFSDGRF